jgi:hypothetical protein
MSWKMKIAILLSLLFVAGVLFVAYEYRTTTAQENVMVGDHKILLLCVDPSEKRPGMGAVDMAFVVSTHDGSVVNTTPIYPHHLTHPTAPPPQYLQEEGLTKLYLHDSLWSNNTEAGAKLAQEIVEYNTGYKTDIVVIVNPEAVDAMINAIGPLYVEGQGYVTVSSIDLIREEQYNQGISRGNAVESVMNPIKDAIQDKTKFNAFLKAAAVEYAKGNIVVVPKDAFIKIAIANGFQSLL